MKRNLQTVAGFAASGPLTQGQIRWLLFNAATNGLRDAGAVVHIGRRVYIDVDRFDRWVDTQNNSAPQAAA